MAKESKKDRSVEDRERMPLSPWKGGIYFNFSLTCNQRPVKANVQKQNGLMELIRTKGISNLNARRGTA